MDSEDPVEKFFDLENISFSHLSCNIKARHYSRPHGAQGWKNGCRCEVCKDFKKKERIKAKNKKMCNSNSKNSTISEEQAAHI